MPLGKYYCEYCDKQFQDTPNARKRHLKGGQHQRARYLWYKNYNEPQGHVGDRSVIENTTISRGVCQHFIRTGNCNYGDNCKYFHPKQEAVNTNVFLSGLHNVQSLESQNILNNQLSGGNSLSGNVANQLGVSWGNLPPSLRPPPEGGYPLLPFVDWE